MGFYCAARMGKAVESQVYGMYFVIYASISLRPARRGLMNTLVRKYAASRESRISRTKKPMMA